MKKYVLQVLLSVPIWFWLGGAVSAMCIWFAEPTRLFMPATDVQVLIQQDKGTSRLVVQPEFSGDASNFALVMPFPSEPTLSAPSEDIFIELEDLTNPFTDFAQPSVLESAGGFTDDLKVDKGVRVVAVEKVGDYEATTLAAESSKALVDWLQENNYELTDDKQKTLDYYVASGSEFFVALKVDVATDAIDERGFVNGGLDPIQFEYKSSRTQLPLRLMAGSEASVDLTIFTLADNTMFVPGAEIQFSRKVTADDIAAYPSLQPLEPRSQWLVRNSFTFNPAKVTRDIDLSQTSDAIIVDPAGRDYRGSLVLDPDTLPSGSGINVSQQGILEYTTEATTPPEIETIPKETPQYLWLVTIALGISNMVMLVLVTRGKK